MDTDTRARIMEAAEGIFVEKGFSGSSMKLIAQKAGVAKSLIYHYFSSKRELWSEVVHRRVDQARLSERLTEMLSWIIDHGLDSFKEQRGHTTYFKFMSENPQFVRMLSWLNAEQVMSCGPSAEIREGVIRKLETLQRKGVFRDDIDPRLFVICFMALCETWFMSRSRVLAWLGEDADLESAVVDYMEAVGKILLEGMEGTG